MRAVQNESRESNIQSSDQQAGSQATVQAKPKAWALDTTKAISVELRKAARQARLVKPASSGGGGFKARRSEKLFKLFVFGSFFLVFVIPVLIASIYLWGIAAKQYTSEARFTVKSSETGGIGDLIGLSSLFSDGQGSDNQIIGEFIRSRAAVEELQKQFDFEKIFGLNDYDVLAKLGKHLSIDQITEYWKGQIALNIDRNSGLVALSVRSFSPSDSLNLTKSVLEMSERLVNKLTRRKEQDAYDLAKSELDRSEKKLEAAVLAQRDARNAMGILDIDTTAKMYGEIITSLRLQLSKIEQSIDGLVHSNVQNSPQLGPLRAQAQALQQQIDRYESSLAGGATVGKADEATMASRSALMARTEIEVGIARANYVSAVASFEQARVTMEQQRAYLLVYVAPRLAERSTYPQRGLLTFATVFIAFITWSLVVGGGILIRDNMA